MPRISVHAWKTNAPVQESSVPELLRITLQLLRVLSAAPAQLRRRYGCWRLAAAPSRLADFRVMVVIVLGVLGLPVFILDLFPRNTEYPINFSKKLLPGFISAIDHILLLTCHITCEQNLKDKIKNLVSMLQQLEKINISLNGAWYSTRNQKIKVNLLICYILWTFMSLAVFELGVIYTSLDNINDYKAVINVLFLIIQYQYLMITIHELQWSVTIAEISSTVSTLNSKIRQLLQYNTADPEDLHLKIRSLGQYYETICDITRQIEKDNGMFFLFIIMYKFAKLLMTPYNLINSLGGPSEINIFLTLIQINWCINHLVNLLIIVEPCHWTRDQMERTLGLLIRLASRTGQRPGRVSTELNLFILQVNMWGNSFMPMGVFTISRPLVASILSGVTTYLAIAIQSQSDPDLLD